MAYQILPRTLSSHEAIFNLGWKASTMVKCFAQWHKHHGFSHDSNLHSDDSETNMMQEITITSKLAGTTMCWLSKEPLWSRRFEQYTMLVFRRMLDCWWCWGLSWAGGMHIWAGRIQVVFARWCVGVGCWLSVCALGCVSVVVSCCWKGGLE